MLKNTLYINQSFFRPLKWFGMYTTSHKMSRIPSTRIEKISKHVEKNRHPSSEFDQSRSIFGHCVPRFRTYLIDNRFCYTRIITRRPCSDRAKVRAIFPQPRFPHIP